MLEMKACLFQRERALKGQCEMKAEALSKAVALAKKANYVFLATADETGLPHVAAAGEISVVPIKEHVTVDAWFCPGTVANLQMNRHTAIVIWDSQRDKGFQLLGETEQVEEIAMMDGYAPGMENRPIPQVKRRLLVRVDKIIGFRNAPHTDEEEPD
jgi:uncharacterized protein